MNKLSWSSVGLIAVLGAIAVALATLAHWTSGEILGVVGILAGIGGVGVVGGAVAGKVEDVHQATTAQTQTLATIEKNTNGQLAARDARIADLEARLRAAGGQP